MAALTVLLALGVLPILLLLVASRASEDNFEPLDVRLAGLASALIWSAMLTFITYGLSLVNAFNRFGLSLGWGAALAGLALYGWRSGRLRGGWRNCLQRLRSFSGTRFDAILLATGLVYISLLFLIAWVAPPNTNDSLRYHMGRVMHWQQNQSIAHYNTPIAAQLWMPPWSELAIANLVILSGSDRLANLVQWLAMAGSLAGVTWIAKKLGAGPSGQVFASIFALTLPMGILQSTSTQNDYTNALWAVGLAAFGLEAWRRQPSYFTAGLVGLSAGLGILTKGTFIAFGAPFLLAWLAGLGLRRAWRRLAAALAILLLSVGLLNSYFWVQNSLVFGSALGPVEGVRQHANAAFTPAALLSNLVRNTSLHLGTPYGIINGNLQKAVVVVHTWMGQDVNDPATSLDEYRVKRYLTEDRAGNPWHLVGVPVLAAGAWLTRRRAESKTVYWNPVKNAVNSNAIIYGVLLLAGFILFSALYKWQSTGSRLQLPWFVLLAPLAGVVWQQVSPVVLRNAVSIFFLFVGLPFVVNNPSRPFLPFRGDPVTIWNTPRQVLLFRNTPEVMPGYISLTARLQASGCREAGLRIDSSDPEYLFWALLKDPAKPLRLEHLFPDPPIAPAHLEGFTPCAVICTFCDAPSQYGLPLDSTHYGGYSLYLAPP